MNLILAIDLQWRLAALFLVGLFAGSLVNLGIYRLAWFPRSISPWSAPPSGGPPRRRWDRIPILGWLFLRRESGLHGTGFWIRPVLVELLTGLGLAALYWWEVDRQGLLRAGVLRPGATILHVQYICHVALMALMLIGSLIDFDEKIIPDSITVPGTLGALVVAAVFPWSLLPDLVRVAGAGGFNRFAPVMAQPAQYDFLRLTSPNGWPDWLGGFPNTWPLAIGLTCWWLWCLGLMHRTWYSRHGWRRAFGLMTARLLRERSTLLIGLLGLVGTSATVTVWCWSGDWWQGLLTALVGMAASGGLVWTVRVIGSAVLNREAMGFGDVTLMAMIGAFLGWQASLVVFFLAPFAGLVLGLLNLIIHRESEIPYGPFLCLAAGVVLIRWVAVWQWSEPLFRLGPLVPLLIVVCLVLMALMLGVMRLVREAFR